MIIEMMVEPLPCFIQLFFKKETLTPDQNISSESFHRAVWSGNTTGQKVVQPRKGNCKRKAIKEGGAKNNLTTSTSEKSQLSFLKKQIQLPKP